MRTKTMTGGLVLALALTLMPPPTQATCAWVFWAHENRTYANGQTHSSAWRISSTHATVGECQQSLREVRDIMQRHLAQLPNITMGFGAVSLNPNHVVIGYKENATQVLRTSTWVCMPDTLHPDARGQ